MFNKNTELVKAQYELACIEHGVCRHMKVPCGICSDPECTWEYK